MKRIERVGDVRFVTFSCFRRLGLLGSATLRDAFAETLAEHRERTGVRLLGYVIMPEHVHLLLLPPHTLSTVAPFLHGVKYSFAQRVIKHWRTVDAPVLRSIVDTDHRCRYWQRGGGYDRNIFGDSEFHEKLEYMHMNPAKRGLVDSPLDWAWSSARWYSDRRDESLIPIDQI